MTSSSADVGDGVVVFGAGLIGTFVGGSLAAAGARVRLVGRPRLKRELDEHGLTLTDIAGGTKFLAAHELDYSCDPVTLATARLVLVTVKSRDTRAAAEAIAAHAPPTASVMTLQNGIGNAEILRATLPGRTIVSGIVGFNVVSTAPGRLVRATEGGLVVEASPALDPWVEVFRAAHLPLRQDASFASAQWGKLLLNLNNAVNALADLPLREELSQRDYRRCLALLVEEALSALARAGIRPTSTTRLSPRLLPAVLRLPDPVFARVAGAMMRIDPQARSSMWEDLAAGRMTEVDYLNGAVVRLAASVGSVAPANQRITELVHRVENGAPRPPAGAALYRLLRG